jgi:hypothetical protein
MKISGVVRFQQLSAPAINILREFQRKHREIAITFDDDLSNATANWESFDSMSRLTRVVAAIEIQEVS